MANDAHSTHSHDHHHDAEVGNTELVNALRKSFGILKFVMAVLVVL